MNLSREIKQAIGEGGSQNTTDGINSFERAQTINSYQVGSTNRVATETNAILVELPRRFVEVRRGVSKRSHVLIVAFPT